MPQEMIDTTIEEWNKKNYEPLKLGYVKAQLSWHAKNTPKMPPNFDKSHYRDIGIPPTAAEIKTKNPVSYAIKMYLGKKYSYNKKNSK